MVSCKEYRRRARYALGESIFNQTWLYALLACILVSAITSVISSTGVLAPFTFLVFGSLQFGRCAFFLEGSRDSERKNDINLLFTGFTDNLGRNILAGILYQLFVFLWSLLLFIPGIIMSYAYSMTFFVLKDHPEYSAYQALQVSRKMMKGYKMKAFLLDLSFIGWILVGILCCGIGMLWVSPYMQAAKVELYESIKDRENGYAC